jgi:phospholipid-binding lipoprotein MlaA
MQMLRTESRCSIKIIALAALLAAGGCATPPSEPAARAEFEQTNDPLEPLNREIFAFNQFLDRILIKPIAVTYQASVPDEGRTAIRNILSNLHEPIVFANNVLQGEFKRAGETAGRFAMNSTIGFAGLFDFATTNGLEKQIGDFGQTLYTWGAPEGPYLFLPIVGPSSPRDAIGYGVDSAADPYLLGIPGNTVETADYGRFAVNGVDQRAQNIQTLDELQRSSIDFYAQLRSLYRQHRAAELRHGEPPPLPELDNDDESPPKH